MSTSHITDHDLEMYALDRLADDALVEEHLLACEECRARLAGWDGTATNRRRRDPFPISDRGPGWRPAGTVLARWLRRIPQGAARLKEENPV